MVWLLRLQAPDNHIEPLNRYIHELAATKVRGGCTLLG